MMYGVLLTTTTWAGAELAFRGRGPPPVPRRINLVRVPCAHAGGSSRPTPKRAPTPARNARRFTMSCPASVLMSPGPAAPTTLLNALFFRKAVTCPKPAASSLASARQRGSHRRALPLPHQSHRQLHASGQADVDADRLHAQRRKSSEKDRPQKLVSHGSGCRGKKDCSDEVQASYGAQRSILHVLLWM